MTMGFDPVAEVREQPLERYQAGLAEYLAASAADAWESGPLMSVGRILGTMRENIGALATGQKLLTPEEASARGKDLGLAFDQPVSEGAYRILEATKQEEIARQSVFQRARANNGYGTAMWLAAGGVEGLTMMVDPLNIVSAFVPVVGQARYAAMAARIGPLGAGAARAAAEGVVGQALLEPITAIDRARLGNEYGLMDSLINVSFGAGLGVALHGAAYGLGGGFRFMVNRFREQPPPPHGAPGGGSGAPGGGPGAPGGGPGRGGEELGPAQPPALAKVEGPPPRQRVAEAMEVLSEDTKAGAMKVAIAQLVQDKPVDVGPVLRADPAYRRMADAMGRIEAVLDVASLRERSIASAMASAPTLRPPPGWAPQAFQLDEARRIARGLKSDRPAGEHVRMPRKATLTDFVVGLGGIARDTAEGKELWDSFDGKPPWGLFKARSAKSWDLASRKGGKHIDELAGWARNEGFQIRYQDAGAGEGTDTGHFVELLLAEHGAGGRKSYRDTDMADVEAYRVEQEGFVEWYAALQEKFGNSLKGEDPLTIAWLLQQDRQMQRLWNLLGELDSRGHALPEDKSIELEWLMALEREAAELDEEILAPGSIDPDAFPLEDRSGWEPATLEDMERWYADLERAAGEGREGQRAAVEGPAAGRPDQDRQAEAVGPDRDHDPPAPAGLRRQDGAARSEAAAQGTAADVKLPADLATERTGQGEQTLLPGVEPVTDRQRAEAGMAGPLRGGAADLPSGGLFDLGVRRQRDLFDASTARGAEVTPETLGEFAERQPAADLHATPDTLPARDERLDAAERDVKGLLESDMATHGAALTEADRVTLALIEAESVEHARAVDALAQCKLGGAT